MKEGGVKVAGHFTQGRGLAPRPMGSPRLAPGIIPGALAYPSRPKGQEGAPPSKEGEEKKKRKRRKNKRRGNKTVRGPTLPSLDDRQRPRFWEARAMIALHYSCTFPFLSVPFLSVPFTLLYSYFTVLYFTFALRYLTLPYLNQKFVRPTVVRWYPL